MTRPCAPLVAVDLVIELPDRPSVPIVLIERRYTPYGFALPGGFVDVGETLERAAIREAEEETALTVRLVRLLGCYSDPARDPRGHTISAVYVGEARGIPCAQDDAKAVGIFDITVLPNSLAFDHDVILRDYLRFRGTGILPAVRNG